MARENISTGQITAVPRRISEKRRFIRVLLSRRVVVFGVVVIVALIIVAIITPLISPFDPYKPNLTETLQQPSAKHLLGTDALGRDTLSRILYGSQTSLLICILVTGFATVIGSTLGLLSGYFGGWTYTIIMRCVDALMAFPMILLALVIAALLGGGVKNVIIALSIAMLPVYARLMCGQVLTVKENDYVLAGHAIGASNLRIMFRHVVFNCFPPIIVIMTMQLGGVILAEAGLSFLGIGIEAPTAAWGSMINDGRQYLLTLPILSFAPGVAIMLVVFGFNMVGDGLRDALDPRLRGVL
jgi:peptide/nickel transport system permease protein